MGIGTQNPTKGKLVVQGTVGAVSAMFGDNTTGVAIENSFPGIGLNSYFNGARKAIGTGFGGLFGLNPNNGDLYMMSSTATGAADTNMPMDFRMLINKDGNIGVQGVSVPAMPFTFNNVIGNKIALFGQSATAHYGLGIQSSQLQFYTPTTADDITFGIGSSTNFTENMRITGDGNVGIGVNAPNYKLDLNGRMRIKHNGSTAGIYFDGTSAATRSFIGTYDNDYVGIYGSGGAGWNFAMNVNNGNTGIGTTAPTTKLDVNGDVRIRGSFPSKGDVLTSEDANGNATWAGPVAFRVSGVDRDAIGSSFPVNTWNKLIFENAAEYNVGFAYQPLQSQFSPAEDGIYHFNSQIHLSGYGDYFGMRLRLNRAGTISTIATQTKTYNLENAPTLTDVIFIDGVTITTDMKLLAGDIVWVEFIFDTSYINSPFQLSTLNERTWFSGHLVARL